MSIITPNGLGASIAALTSTTSQKPSINIFPSPQNTFIALLALISQLLGHGLMAYALRHVDVVLASVSALARPVAAFLLGFFFFDEQ
ncbi:EamA family transporter, partial [Pseudomonas syringae]|uniref:EamA family transporter n=1 Tax=Pseudomonas syringae TaxID=317 RepID=UPI001F51494E